MGAYLHVSHFDMYHLVLMTLASFRWQVENFRLTNPAEVMFKLLLSFHYSRALMWKNVNTFEAYSLCKSIQCKSKNVAG